MVKQDLKGKTFGSWTVIEYAGNRKWLCECKCKTRKEVSTYSLTHNKSTSCGCGRHGRLQNLVGERFSDWTVIEYAGNSKWLCECSCGVRREVSGESLKSETSKSCGHDTAGFKNLKDKRYGQIVVEEYIGNKQWKCRCDCGNTLTIYSDKLKDGNYLMCKECKTAERKKSMHSELDVKNFEETRQRAENELANLIPDATLNRRDILKSGSEIDIYSESSRVGIEFNGSYWHSEKFKDKKYHINKTNEAFRQNIRLIHIFEYEWDNIEKQDKLKRLVQRAVGGTEIKKIYARKCKVKYISNRIAKDFIDKYHLQGFASSTVYYGVYYNDELVGVVTFGIPRFNKRYEYELVRLCWKDDVSVIGGAEKVFKKFIKDYDPENILSYCDISKFSGNVYKKLGFKLISISDPNYVWWSASENKILTRYQCQKHKLVKNGLGTVDETEVQIMQRLGFLRIHDCGNMVFGWEKEK